MLESIKLVKISVIKYNDTLSKYDVCVRLWNLTLLYVNDHVRDKYYILTNSPCAHQLHWLFMQCKHVHQSKHKKHTFWQTPSGRFHKRIWLATVSEGPEAETSIRPSCCRANVEISSVCPIRCLWVPEWRSSMTTRHPLV